MLHFQGRNRIPISADQGDLNLPLNTRFAKGKGTRAAVAEDDDLDADDVPDDRQAGNYAELTAEDQRAEENSSESNDLKAAAGD